MSPRMEEIVDLASRRPRAPQTAALPAEVWEDVQAADRLWHELRADGREVRFDTGGPPRTVVASLRDVDGTEVRPLTLRVVTRMDDDGPSAA